MTTDHQLRTDVLAALDWEPSISADHISVTAKDGVVTLSGHVETYWQKQAAETAAGRVKAFRAVAEEIEVRLPLHVKRGDDEIAAAALDRMSWDASIPDDAVKVRVEKGLAILTGKVAGTWQKNGAALGLRSLMGATGVSNQITVAPTVDSPTIGDDIRHALHRSWCWDDNIEVSAGGGRVHLTGEVGSWRERELASATAWAAKGATAVQTDFTIAA